MIKGCVVVKQIWYVRSEDADAAVGGFLWVDYNSIHSDVVASVAHSCRIDMIETGAILAGCVVTSRGANIKVQYSLVPVAPIAGRCENTVLINQNPKLKCDD